MSWTTSYIISFLVQFEKHATVGSQEESEAVKNFVSDVANTGVVVLITWGFIVGESRAARRPAHAALLARAVRDAGAASAAPRRGAAPLFTDAARGRHPAGKNHGLGRLPFLFDGNIQDFNREWYSTVGASITRTMLTKCISENLKKPVQYVVSWGSARMQCWFATTQEELDVLNRRPEFSFAANYGRLLGAAYVTLAFSALLPVLLWFFVANCLLEWVLAKYWLLELCRKPPRLNDRIYRMSMLALPFACVVHGFYGYWAFGAARIWCVSVAPPAPPLSTRRGATCGNAAVARAGPTPISAALTRGASSSTLGSPASTPRVAYSCGRLGR